MACEMTSGFNDRLCTTGIGGIKSVLFFPIESIDSKTKTDNEITDLVVNGETFHYKLRSDLSSYTAPIRRSDENGTLWYEQTLNVILNQDNKELRTAIHLLGQNLLTAMVEKADGTYVLLGEDSGLKVGDASEYGSGVLKSDRNGHTIVLSSLERDEVPDVEATVAATLISQSSYASV